MGSPSLASPWCRFREQGLRRLRAVEGGATSWALVGPRRCVLPCLSPVTLRSPDPPGTDRPLAHR